MPRVALSVFALTLALAACGGGAETSEEPAPAAASAGDEAAVSEPASQTASDAATTSLPNQRRLEGGLVVGGQPTEADLRAAAQQGYSTVVSLRTPSEPGFEEERAQAEALGLDFRNVPVDGAEGITVEHAREVDAILANAEGPVLLHCGSSNRVGAILALRAFLNGADVEAAMQAGRDAGLTSLEDAVHARLTSRCQERPERTC